MSNQIFDLLSVSLKGIKDIVDVNTIVGEAIKLSDELVIVPISKVKMGFLTGGSEIKSESTELPFGGGTGGSVSIQPVAFLVAAKNEVKLLSFNDETHLYERVIENVPAFFEQIKNLFSSSKEE